MIPQKSYIFRKIYYCKKITLQCNRHYPRVFSTICLFPLLYSHKFFSNKLITTWCNQLYIPRSFLLWVSFSGSKITADGDCRHEINRRLLLGKKSYDKPRQHTKKQRHYFANKGVSSQSLVLPVAIRMWELDHKGWVPKNWYFWTMVLEKTLESSLDCKEVQLVHPKGNQLWIFIGKSDAEAETPIHWPPDAKN